MFYDSFFLEDWEILTAFEVTCKDSKIIIELLEEIESPFIEEALDNIERCEPNSGFTYSNIKLKKSLIVITKTTSDAELINTLTHEYIHLLFHIQKYLNITSEEEFATLNGYLNMKSYQLLKRKQAL